MKCTVLSHDQLANMLEVSYKPFPAEQQPEIGIMIKRFGFPPGLPLVGGHDDFLRTILVSTHAYLVHRYTIERISASFPVAGMSAVMWVIDP